MNKLLIPFLCLFIFFSSCSDDSSNKNTTTVDPLIGKWKWIKEIVKDSKGNIISEDAADACDLMDDIVFDSNGTGSITSHSSENDECFLGATISVTKWVNNNDGTYTFSFETKEEDERADAEEGSTTLIFKITFSNDLSTLTMSEEDETDSEVGIIIYESILKRQE